MSQTVEISPLPILDKLQRLAKEHLGLASSECTAGFDFAGIDALDSLTFLIAVEGEFHFAISDCEMFTLGTFGDVINLVESKQ
jgi:acyl carrier protein